VLTTSYSHGRVPRTLSEPLGEFAAPGYVWRSSRGKRSPLDSIFGINCRMYARGSAAVCEAARSYEHLFMTSQGSAYARFRRALE
jgi:hypothetical protein